MSDLIRREDALAVLCFSQETGQMVCGDLRKLLEEIKAIPSAEPERKKGEWTEKEVFTSGKGKIKEWQTAKCSACGRYHTTPYLYYFGDYNFCPMCGAEMRGE